MLPEELKPPDVTSPALLWTSHHYQPEDETETQSKAKPLSHTGQQNGSHWTDNPESSGLPVIWTHTLPYWLSHSEPGFNYSQEHP